MKTVCLSLASFCFLSLFNIQAQVIDTNLSLTISVYSHDLYKTNYFYYTNTSPVVSREVLYGYLPNRSGGTTNDSDRIGPVYYQPTIGMTTVVQVLADRAVDLFEVYLSTTNGTHIRMPHFHNEGVNPVLMVINGFDPSQAYKLQIGVWNNFPADNYDNGFQRSDFSEPYIISPECWSGTNHLTVYFNQGVTQLNPPVHFHFL